MIAFKEFYDMKELILQDIILNQARREKSKVIVKLVGGD